MNWYSDEEYGHRISGIGSSGSRVSKTVFVDNDGENDHIDFPKWECNSNKIQMLEEFYRIFRTEFSTLATVFVIKMVEGRRSNHQPSQKLWLFDCLMLRLWPHHIRAATPVESSSRYSELEQFRSHSCLLLTIMPALSECLACHASNMRHCPLNASPRHQLPTTKRGTHYNA